MRLLLIASLVGGLLVCGCGSQQRLVLISGEVSFDGKPIERGEIIFRPLEGTAGQETGGAIENGRYDVPQWVGVVAGGTYRVEILGLMHSGRIIRGPIDSEDKDTEMSENYIPAEYNTRSTLQVTIPPNASDHKSDFDLETHPSAP